MEIIFNVAYSPQYNPIEFVFSQVKRTYKNLATAKIVNFESQKTFELIQTAFQEVKVDSVRNSIEYSQKTVKSDVKEIWVFPKIEIKS